MSIPIIGLALGALGQVASFVGQNSAADASVRAQQENIRRQQAAERLQQQATLKAARIQQDQVRLREQQQQEQLGRKRFEEQRKSRRELGTAKAGAATAGVSGVSVDSLLLDFEQQNAFLQESIARQAQFVGVGAQSEVDSIRQQAEQGVIPAPVPVVQRPETPSGLSLGLGIGTSVLNSGIFG